MHTRAWFWLGCALAVLLSSLVATAQGSSVFVSDQDGSDITGTGSATKPFKSISAALNALAQIGADNITLLPGTYSGPNNTNLRIPITSSTVRIISAEGPLVTLVGHVGDYRVFQVGGEAKNGTTSISLPYRAVNGTDNAATGSIRDDSWRALVPHLVLSGLTIVGGSATKGGALYVEGGVMKMLNCRIVMGGHGAVYVKGENSKMLAANSVFAQNGAAHRPSGALKSGGAVFLESGIFHCDTCRFANNSATQHGGAIFAASGSIRLSNTNVSHNAAVEGGGGGVFFANTSGKSYLVNTNFRNNTAVRGGGVFVGGHSGPQFMNCSFWANSVKHIGGGLLASDNTHVGLKRTSFVQNSALTSGGALALMGNSTATVGIAFINRNQAATGGGIFVSGKASPVITNTIISENMANNGAGVLFSDYSKPTLHNCDISHNHASRGGAIYVDDNTRPHFTGCRIKANFASLDGGALFAAFDSAPEFHECHFLDNSSNLGDPFHISRSAQDQIKFTMCSVFPHPKSFDEPQMTGIGFAQPLNVV